MAIRLLDRYELRGELGTGTSGVVHLARDLQLARDVAIKVLRQVPAGDDARRFEREAQIAAAFRHPDVVTVYDVGESDGVPFIVMELVTSRTLESLLANDAPPTAAAIEIAVKLATVLSAAHTHGVVHRDLKPGNIFVEGTLAMPGRCRLVDFGLAFMVNASSETLGRFTGGGVMLGTPLYMSPEQAEARIVGPPADIYSLGCTIHELIVGRPPFAGNVARVIAGHLYLPPVPLRDLAPEVPAALERIVLDMLAKDPAARPRASEIVEALTALDVPAAPRSSTPQPRRGRVTGPPVVGLDAQVVPITLHVRDAALEAGLRARGFEIVDDADVIITSLEDLPVHRAARPFVLHPAPSVAVIAAAIRGGAIGVSRWPAPLDRLAQQLRGAGRIRRIP